MEQKKKEKKVTFSEEIDNSISGFALVITFITVGIFLLFKFVIIFLSINIFIINYILEAYTMINIDSSTVAVETSVPNPKHPITIKVHCTTLATI